MKSEKAKQRLYESFTFNSNIGIDLKAAIEAVELAEQEAEERMRKKAISAFCENECGGTCGICEKVVECATLRKFTQKLTEE